MRLVITFSLSLILLSCKVEEATPTTPVNDTFDPSKATLIKSGSFVGVNHDVSGTVSLYDSAGIKTILLDPFSCQNGPDLKVYFSNDENASTYINLGKLKSTSGKQSYEVPANTSVADYNYVLIWCEQFTVLFGKAQLK